ncbi:MAG TPA: phosphatase PAP2 family protein [Candidatus Acidoferrum sp.]|nr:phosphatase PAP2 family protein [Candidatus Acidoferrum sp.]
MPPALAQRRVLIAAVFSLLVFGSLIIIALTPALHGLDRQLKLAFDATRHPILEVTMRTATRMGDGWMLLVFTVVTWLVLRRAGDRLASRLPVVMLGSAAAEWLLKWLVARRRPRGGPFAFPSGHVFTSVVFFGAVIYLLWTRDVARPWRLAGTTVCALLIVGIALSRMYLRFHWLTDVLGGLSGGAAYLLIALAIADRPPREVSA